MNKADIGPEFSLKMPVIYMYVYVGDLMS